MKDKDVRRKRLASLSFTQKVKLLEKLRKRSLAIATSGLRAKAAIRRGSPKSAADTALETH